MPVVECKATGLCVGNRSFCRIRVVFALLAPQSSTWAVPTQPNALRRPSEMNNVQHMPDDPDLEALAHSAGGYTPEAFAFVGESLRHAVRLHGKDTAEGESRHLTAHELVEGVLDLATTRFGLLAELVLREWGIKQSEDVGRITFALIELGVFSKQPTDTIEDFMNGPAFGRALTKLSKQRLCEIKA